MAQWHALVSLPFVLLSSSALAATKVGIVGAVNSSLTAQFEGAAERELQVGDTVFMGEKLRTSESGSAQLMFLDRSALTISPNSTVTIDSFVFDTATELGEMSMSAGAGAFRFIGGALSKKNPVTIKTPVSTIGIRGGVGDTFVEPQGQTQSVFHHGEAMTMTNAKGVTSVTSEAGTGFSQDTADAKPAPMTPQQISQRTINTPVTMATNVAPSADAASLEKVNQQLQPTNPSAVQPTETPAAPQTTPQSNAAPTDAGTQTGADQTADPAAAQAEPTANEQPAEQVKLDKPATDQPLSQGEIDGIRSNPQSLLDKFPKGGVQMADYVSRAIATDPSLVDSLGGALEVSTPAQSSAIGAGLARGGRLIGAQNPQALEGLSKSVQQLNNPHVSRVFNAIGPKVPAIGAHSLPGAMQTYPASNPPLGQRPDSATEKRSLRGLNSRPNGQPNANGNVGAPNPVNSLATNKLAAESVNPITAAREANQIWGNGGFGAVMLPSITSIVATGAAQKETVSTSPTK